MNKEEYNNESKFRDESRIYEYLSYIIFMIIGYTFVDLIHLYYVGSDMAQFVVTASSFIVSVGIYLITQKQSDGIESNTKELKVMTSELASTQQKLLNINNRLDDELMGHTENFPQLMEKIVDTLNKICILPDSEHSIKIMLPVFSLGKINKSTSKLYSQLKNNLEEIILSEKKVDIYMLNLLSGKFENRTNPVSAFLNAIIESSIAKGNAGEYETNYHLIISDYLNSTIDILSYIHKSNYLEKKNIYMLDTIIQGCVCFSGIAECHTLTFYIGADVIQEIDNNSKIDRSAKEKFISTGYYSKTKESNILTNCFVKVQHNKFNAINLFEKISLLDLYWSLKDLVKRISAFENNIIINANIDSFTQKINERKYKYEKIMSNKIELYSFNKEDTNRTILFAPSAAGIYSIFSDYNKQELYRLDLYQDLCLDISKTCNANVVLCSFSGMGIITKDKESSVFSLQQGVEDLKMIIKHLEERGKHIIGIWGICVGAQIAIEHRIATQSKIPVFIWSMPSLVGWNKLNTLNMYDKIYKSVNFQEDIKERINEPIESIRQCNYKDWKMYYAYAANATDLQNYNGICEMLQKDISIKCEQYTNLFHIPMQKQCESEYIRLLKDSKDFFDGFHIN